MRPGVERIHPPVRVGVVGTEVSGRRDLPPAAWTNTRRSSAISLVVRVPIPWARFANALRQIRSSSLGIVSSICRGGRGSVDLIRLQDIQERITLEWFLSGQQLVEHDAQAEDVGPPIDPVTFAPGLLGTHVGRCPLRHHPCRSPRL